MIFGILGISLFLPLFIKPGFYHTYQVFLIISASLLYIFFLRMQSKEHNFYFRFDDLKHDSQNEKTPKPAKHLISKKEISAAYHIIMLIITIAVISFLAETLSVTIDNAIDLLHWPAGIAGLIIAIIIISPEALTAFRAGLNNDMQRVVNISLGSVLSTISVTVPAVLITGMVTRKEVILGLEPVQSAMIIISMLVGVISYKDGETNALQGFIHLILFITFVVLIFV
jgi:Ca2+:H+ antiporter